MRQLSQPVVPVSGTHMQKIALVASMTMIVTPPRLGIVPHDLGCSTMLALLHKTTREVLGCLCDCY